MLSADPAPEVVNKRELAAVLGVSLPTLNNYLDRYADFPVLEPGANGKEWRFDALAVRAYLAQRDAEEARAEAARRERIAQLGLPLTDPGDAAGGPATYTLDDLKRIREADALRLKRGFLADVQETRLHLSAAVGAWNRAQASVLRQTARDFNLPDAVVRAIEDRMADAQRQFVSKLRRDADLFGEGDDERRLA
jgi:hypothetical protein